MQTPGDQVSRVANVPDSALIGPVLEVHVPDGQGVVVWLDMIGESVTVGHVDEAA